MYVCMCVLFKFGDKTDRPSVNQTLLSDRHLCVRQSFMFQSQCVAFNFIRYSGGVFSQLLSDLKRTWYLLQNYKPTSYTDFRLVFVQTEPPFGII